MKTPSSKTKTTTAKKAKAKTIKMKTFNAVNNICGLATDDMTDIGTFFDQADAAQRLTNYFTATNTSPDDPTLVYGQLFGLSMIRQLLNKVTAFNTQAAGVNPITGIRIYDAMSVRPNLPPPDNTTMFPDVVLIPVTADGNDIFSIHDAIDPLMTLSGGMPCPNECGTGFYLKLK